LHEAVEEVDGFLSCFPLHLQVLRDADDVVHDVGSTIEVVLVDEFDFLQTVLLLVFAFDDVTQFTQTDHVVLDHFGAGRIALLLVVTDVLVLLWVFQIFVQHFGVFILILKNSFFQLHFIIGSRGVVAVDCSSAILRHVHTQSPLLLVVRMFLGSLLFGDSDLFTVDGLAAEVVFLVERVLVLFVMILLVDAGQTAVVPLPHVSRG